jgi:sarcosine oxidase
MASDESDARYDVIVVGLGAHGSASVASLSKRGLQVLGIEQSSAGLLTHGSSHGQSRVIRLGYFEDPSYVPLVARSFELWKELEDNAHCKLLTMTGSLMIGRPTSEIIIGTLASCKQHELEHLILNKSDVRARYNDTFQMEENEIAIFEKNAGVLYPEESIQAYQDQAKKSGNATLLFNHKMTSFHENDEGIVTVTTDDGSTWMTSKLIMTAGAWTGEVLGPAFLEKMPLTVVRKVLHWFEPEMINSNSSSTSDDPFHITNFPVYIWDCDESDGTAFYGFPKLDDESGCKVAIHQSKSRDGVQVVCMPDTINRTVSNVEVEDMRSILRSRLPALATGKLLKSVTCMYTNTENQHFFIDFHPNHTTYKNIIICSACSGHGFKMSPVIGEILADLAQFGKTEIDISLFKLNGR